MVARVCIDGKVRSDRDSEAKNEMDGRLRPSNGAAIVASIEPAVAPPEVNAMRDGAPTVGAFAVFVG